MIMTHFASPRSRCLIAFFLCVLTAAMPCAPVVAQADGSSGVVASRIELSERISAAFDTDNFERAASLVGEYLDQWPNDHTMLYNAACAYSMLGERDKAADYLWRAVEGGFTDFTLDGGRILILIRSVTIRCTPSSSKRATRLIAGWAVSNSAGRGISLEMRGITTRSTMTIG